VLDIKVLGSLEATINGRSVAPSAAKPRQILALLALRAGEVVSVPTLLEEIWGEDPPRSALTTVQTYILQLRRLIGHALDGGAAKNVLVTRFNGYLLPAEVVRVDAQSYDRLSEAGTRAWELGDYVSASRLLRQALDLWSGQVLVDVQKGMPLGIEVTRLEQSCIGVLETRIDADLRLRRHHALLGELAVLIARNPMHENLCAKFMVALYRSGQQWRALEVFAGLRRALADELGIEPSARMQRLQHALLVSDPSLDLPESGVLVDQLA
jgi:DNA-binding SARP family transcriptional activator